MTNTAVQASASAAFAATPFSAEEIDRLRAETPATSKVVHFNHAGDSPSPQPILDVALNHLRREAEIGGYEAAAEATDRLSAVYASIGRLINADPADIAVVENATRGWDMLFYSLPFAPGDRILTSVSEYGSNVIAFLQAAKKGATVEVIPNDAHGATDPDALASMLDDRVKLVAISHMPTNGGLVQPVEAIGRIVREHAPQAVYLVDACQTVGQMPIDVKAIGCHALSATARKYLRGPRGMGFLYVEADLANRLEPPFLDIHAAVWTATDTYEIAPRARRFENWESNISAKLSMGAAADYALSLGLDRIWATVHQRAAELRTALETVPGVTVHDLGSVRGAITTFSVAGVPASDVQRALRAQQINTSVTDAASTRFDMDRRGLTDIVRASAHYVTTTKEIEQLTGALREISNQ